MIGAGVSKPLSWTVRVKRLIFEISAAAIFLMSDCVFFVAAIAFSSSRAVACRSSTSALVARAIDSDVPG